MLIYNKCVLSTYLKPPQKPHNYPSHSDVHDSSHDSDDNNDNCQDNDCYCGSDIPSKLIEHIAKTSDFQPGYIKGTSECVKLEKEVKNKKIKIKDGQSRHDIDIDLREDNIRYYLPCSTFAVWNYNKCFYVAMPCKKWTCRYCCKWKYKEIQQRMNDSIAVAWPIKTHIVLELGDPADNDIMMPAFNDFITFLRRDGMFQYTAMSGTIHTEFIVGKENLQYIWAIEVQGDRYKNYDVIAWHLHILTNVEFGKHEKYKLIAVWNHALSLHGSKSKFNYVETRHHVGAFAGDYLIKYFTKEENQILLERGSLSYTKKRRWGCSKIKDADGRLHSLVPTKTKKESDDIWIAMRLEDARMCLELYKTMPEAFPDIALCYQFIRKKKQRPYKPTRKKLSRGNSTLAAALESLCKCDPVL